MIEMCTDIAPVSSKGFLDIQATIECRFTLKRVRDMIRTYSQMHRTDKYSKHSSVISLNGWMFLYELSSCGFKSRCIHLTNHILIYHKKKLYKIKFAWTRYLTPPQNTFLWFKKNLCSKSKPKTLFFRWYKNFYQNSFNKALKKKDSQHDLSFGKVLEIF